MASVPASSRETGALEKTLTCSICLDAFEDPVTTDCGHSFCKKCLNANFEYNDRMCPLCKKPLSKTPEVNIVLRDIVQQQKEGKSLETNTKLFTGRDGEVACDVCTEQKLRAEKSCLVCLASYCSSHLENHCSTERLKGHKLVSPVENLDDRACLRHGRPLELYSRGQQRCICVRCLEDGPEDVVCTEDEWEQKKVQIENAKRRLEAKIQRRETRVDELNRSVKSCKEQLENEWWDVEAVFTAVLSVVEEAQARALQPLKDRRQVLEKEAGNLKQELEAEIGRFRTTIAELDEISTLEDHVHFLQNFPSLHDLDDVTDGAEVEVDTSLSFGTMRKTTGLMMEKVRQELEKLTSIELKRIPKFTVDVKLDPTTAHLRLVLSDDGKEVKDGGEDQDGKDGGEDQDGKDSGEDQDGKDGGEDQDVKDGGEDQDGKDGGEDQDGKDSGEDQDGKDGGEDQDVKDGGEDQDGKDGGEDQDGKDGGEDQDVKDGGEGPEVDKRSERFDMFASVLGVNSLTSGRSYWEVEVSNKSGWDLGVARADANRKGKLSLSPDDGYWATVHYEDDKYAALTAPPLALSLPQKPEKVGVFVDHEEGVVSFYDLTAQSHVYSFTGCSFSHKLLPYFSPHVKHQDRNCDALIISAVVKPSEQEKMEE
ncbi:E3 ubiquitin-protein ligase TRIM39-like isoform X1 [Scophthalmus maximus]|uniref:E3 ubiquitin-protein ligase TRIM39-like isoform X1 n=1 Tax=Scophthalmus maximus TaxID=52904 RepID=UPI001FA86120|nr:E3 ubiquitin-protein ligase TRIM39-like isoform X1 [Scophthalmus maximus]XP_047192070.1 E3 ubiquitin-protein ligase TRIM39-like isoform X1 [Scophthalmus maximus]